MIDVLDQFFLTHIQKLNEYLPDGIRTVDIALLSELGLLDDPSSKNEQMTLPQCIYAVETADRVTLFNDYFAIWIVPLAEGTAPHTLLLIAKLSEQVPKLEIGFSFEGVHNQAKTILKVLNKELQDIRETDIALSHIQE